MIKYFNEKALQDIREHAEAVWPEESCGLIVKGIYKPFKNIHSNPTLGFAMEPAEYLAVWHSNRIDAIIHSHPDNAPHASLLDMQMQLKTNLPWGICNVKNGKADEIYFWGDDLPVQDLLNRPYAHGIYDCYTHIRDYYRIYFNVLLPSYPRENGHWRVTEANENLIMKNFQNAGFSELKNKPYQKYDVLIFTLGKTEVPNHCAIYLGNNLISHHPYEKRSEIVPVTIYERYLNIALRYQGDLQCE